MNRIIVTNNNIDADKAMVVVDGNKIYFNSNGDYDVEYRDCDDVNIIFIVNDDVTVKLFEYSNNDKIVVNNRYVLGNHSTLLLFKFYANNEILERIVFDLDGEYARVNYNFSNICVGDEKYRIVVNHNKLNTISNINNRSIAIEGAVDFTIDSILPNSSRGCVLNQNTKIINLGDNHSVIRPNMYIDLDDVKARHGSVIGKFSDDELFYLMSRGISYKDSVRLLVCGYIFSNLILDMDKETKILNIVNKYWG